MRYGIVENHKFVLIDENLKRLKNTLPFMPQYSVDMVETYPDDEVEQGFDGNWYEKGHAPEKTLEEARAAKLTELNAAFTAASENAHCQSSAGFEIDANETANRNIEGLVLVLKPEESTLFRDWDNRFHEVTKEQLETMRKEIVVNSQRLYQTKWQIEAAIEAAETVGELDAIVIALEPEITGGQPIAGASYNTDTPVAFTEQRNQSIYGSEVSDGQTA